MEPYDIVFVLIGMALSGLVGVFCGRTREREQEGLVLGAFLGPIGWIIVLLAYPYVAPVPKRPAPFVPRGGKSNIPRLSKYSAQAAKDAAWEKARLGE